MSATPTSYELVCGLEIHAELSTASKMFCGCANDPFHAPAPNTHTCPVCLGMPGALPVANQQAIEWTIKLGLALGCQVNLFSKFDRKNYFYPDLPKGYQISQYDIPFCYDGQVETSFGPVRIHRIHLEEDTGKLLHTNINGENVSLVDFNRGGVPLVEIVTEADITSPAQAKEYGKAIRQTLRYLGFADCDMEQGGLRLEANISVRPVGEKNLPNYKVEVKNINSFRFLEQAISFEVQRQTILRLDGITPKQETRGWNSQNNTTFPQRTKEDAEDYRYFPDPDLPPLRFSESQIAGWRNQLPELPQARIARWQTEFKLESRYGEQLVDTQTQADRVEALMVATRAANLPAEKVVGAVINKKISLEIMTAEPSAILSAYQALVATDTVSDDDLIPAIRAVITSNPDPVSRYQAGQHQLLNFFLGQVMRQLGKKVSTDHLKTLIQKELEA